MFWFVFACAVKVAPLSDPIIDVEPYREQINWTEAEDEATELLQEYLQIDTINPPGNELQGALYLKEILTKL